MGSFTDSLENACCEAFRGTAMTIPSTLYLLLSTTTINDDGSGATEPSGNNYSRTAVAMNTSTWTAASGGAISNAVAITTATASGSWGTITDAALISTSSGAGTTYVYGALSASRTITSGEALSIAIGDFDITVA